MSDYGLNFGFRRSEPYVAEGRFRTPASGTFYLGDLVEVDPANPGFVKLSADNARFEAGFRGFLLQEIGWDLSGFAAPHVDTLDMGKALKGRECAIWAGAGLKVVLTNTEDQTRTDGRTITGRTIVDLTGLAVGSLLAWVHDSNKWAKTTTDANGALRVVALGTNYVEAIVR